VPIHAFLKSLNKDKIDSSIKWNFIDKYFSKLVRKKLRNRDFSIIGNNCFAGGMYHKFGLPYNTPTIWTYIYPDDYLKFLENLDWYLKQPLTFKKETAHEMAHLYYEKTKRRYPIGVLGDIEIHFMHYKTEDEATEKWFRRIKRFNRDNLFVLFSDGEEFREEHFTRFEKLPYLHKVFLSSKPKPNSSCTVFIQDYEKEIYVFDSTRNRRYEKYFDLVKWLNGDDQYIKNQRITNLGQEPISAMLHNYSVTVVIPTYKRVDILPYLLSAFERQTYRNFDLVVVVKPSGDGTEELLKQASTRLKIKTVQQTTGHIVDAYFLGVKHTTGDIVAFLDDDAIPADDWLEETVKIFQTQHITGVTGDSYPVLMNGHGMEIIDENEAPTVFTPYDFALFGHPLKGLEDYKNCIANSGLVYERGNNAYWRKRGATKALLRGPSMAVSGDVLRSIDLGSEWILGCAWEMVLGWQLWKCGLKMIYDPNVKVYHIVHGRTSSRDFMAPRTDLLWAVEAELLFYRLYHDEPQLSLVSKFGSDLLRVAHCLKYMRWSQQYNLRKVEGIFLGNVIGAKWVLYKLIGSKYSPLSDLAKFKRK
jgi:uncharacterized protein (DUF1919 family)/GT2 family glycosyltransferase